MTSKPTAPFRKPKIGGDVRRLDPLAPPPGRLARQRSKVPLALAKSGRLIGARLSGQLHWISGPIIGHG